MKEFYEARDEYDGQLYRVFCVLDSQAPEHGLDAKAFTLSDEVARRPRGRRAWHRQLWSRKFKLYSGESTTVTYKPPCPKK